MQVTMCDHWSVERDHDILFDVTMHVHIMEHEHDGYLQESAQPLVQLPHSWVVGLGGNNMIDILEMKKLKHCKVKCPRLYHKTSTK